jgi:Na+/melibiose symporter-like transporter
MTELDNQGTPQLSERNRKLSVRAKIAYSSGSLEEAMVGAAGVATMVFYNQVLGVSAALCGTAFLIASLVDAVSDPLIGSISDNVHTRWGRRHPFMFAAAFPLALCFYLMYQPPSGLEEYQLFLWFTVTMVGMRLAKTFYLVPHNALGAELTDDYNERTSIFGWNYITGMLGGIAAAVVTLYVIFPSTPDFENGLLDGSRYELLATYGALFILIVVLLCTFLTADQIPYLHAKKNLVYAVKRSYSQATRDTWLNMRALLKNRSYLAVCSCWLILAISGGVLGVMGTYAFIYAFEFSTEQMAIRSFVMLPGAFLAIGFSAYLTKLFDKKLTVVYNIIAACFLIGLPFTLRLIGWFPDNDSQWLLFAFFGIWVLGYIALPVVPIVIDSQLVDIADEHELNTGNRSEGLIFSVRTFAIKLTGGLGGLLGGFGLEIIGFPENASVETLSQDVINGLLFMHGPLYWIIVYAGLGFAMMYKIDRNRHAEILSALELNRSSK